MGGSVAKLKVWKFAPVVLAAGLLAAAAPAGSKRDNPMADICRAEQRLVAAASPHLDIEPGIGSGGFQIRANPQAQNWFNFGMSLFHAFYHDDAKLAFEKAVAADPDCAMCLWGQALSWGSNQNYDARPEWIADGLAMAKKAKDKARTPMETALAEALIARYEAKLDAKSETDFAQAILMAARDDPNAIDLPLLASEADLTAWRRGDKNAGNKAEAVITPILKRHPENTAAIHYYIHATEFAGHSTLALPYARRLADLAPNASHLVHMAAHTFFHAGLYEDAALVNAKALAVDSDHSKNTGRAGPTMYYQHNQGFGLAGAMMAGDGPLAIKFADTVHAVYPAVSFSTDLLNAPMGRGFTAYGRYAPDKMLTAPDPGPRPAVQTFYHYGRGEALASKGDLAGVLKEAAAITDTTPQADIARHVLAGRAAMLKRDYASAIKAYSNAADTQGQLYSNLMDPPPWWYLVQRSIAAARLKQGRYADAKSQADASLASWPNDGLALLVLSQAEQKLGQSRAARAHLAEARKAWHGDLSKISLDLI